MNKRIFIIGTLAVVLVLLSVWAYILVYGTPGSTEDTSTGTDIVSSSDAGEMQFPEANDSFIYDDEPQDQTDTTEVPPLRQITTQPVAGYQFVLEGEDTGNETSTSSDQRLSIYYTELGTGHVYRYNPQSNQRDRLSNQTLQQAKKAFITPDGSRAALLRGYNNDQQLILLDLTSTDENPIIEQRDFNVNNLALAENGDLLYTRRTNSNTVAYRFNFTTESEEQIFTFPLRNITVAWAPTPNGTHYVYQNPSASIRSTVYRVQGNTITRTDISGYNMSLISNGQDIAYSYQTEANNPDTIRSEIRIGNQAPKTVSTVVIKDKCTFTTTSNIACGYGFSEDQFNQQDWARGVTRSNDDLWSINSTIGSSRLLISPERQAGRQIDVFNIQANSDTDTEIIGLQNRRDSGSLWIYTP